MTEQFIDTEARTRVLDAAERLFAERGYKPVTLRDIANQVGIRHTSLYHHAPGGKEQLYVEVVERNLRRHAAGLHEAIASVELTVRAQLQAAADWLLSQPPMDLVRMTHSDLPTIDPVHAARLSQLAFDSMIQPIWELLRQAQARGEINHPDLGLVAGGIVGMLESLHAIPDYALQQSRQVMANQLVDVLLNGLRQR